jgi:hypothetical protein
VLALLRRRARTKAEHRAALRNLRRVHRCPSSPEQLADAEERLWTSIYAKHDADRELLTATRRDPDARVTVAKPSGRFGDDAYGAFLEREHASAAAFATSTCVAERELQAAVRRLTVPRSAHCRTPRSHRAAARPAAKATADPDGPEPPTRRPHLTAEVVPC